MACTARTTAAVLAACVVGCAKDPAPTPLAQPLAVVETRPNYADETAEIAKWLRGQAIETEYGLVWPSDPNDPDSVSMNLYDGMPGVILFFLERHRATDGEDPQDLEDAVRGAEHLLATLPETATSPGFYVGLAGVGFALDETHRATEDERFAEGARRCVELLRESAVETELGVQWDGVTDVISGSAGVGLWLLHHDRLVDEPRPFGQRPALSLAVDIGRELLAVSEPTGHGLRWRMRPGYERIMPNFSHGTAGVAYFLLELDRALRNADDSRSSRIFLDAAISGAENLRALELDRGLIGHHFPNGGGLYYLGWCHGPPGTARLFWRLWEVTGVESYRDDALRMAKALRRSGIPEMETPGFWNNVGICCGSAGVAAFLDDLAAATGDDQDGLFIRRLTDDLLERGTLDDAGLRWVHAEHRVRPDLLAAQTGLMQGAAGVGLWLIRASQSPEDRLRWPDSPF